jgi:hypothetical protein
VKTYQAERAVVAVVLAVSACLTGGGVAWLSALAVLLTFSHAQIADRLSEAEGARPPSVYSVHCRHLLDRYWSAKEATWIGVFVAIGNLPAIAGCVVLGAYPLWRRWWRRVHPRAVAT